MFIISLIGLIVNIVVALIMFKGGDTNHNLNMRGAFIHVLGDLLGSVGAIIASILIWTFNFTIASNCEYSGFTANFEKCIRNYEIIY